MSGAIPALPSAFKITACGYATATASSSKQRLSSANLNKGSDVPASRVPSQKAAPNAPVNVGKQAPSPTAKKATQPPPSTSPRNLASARAPIPGPPSRKTETAPAADKIPQKSASQQAGVKFAGRQEEKDKDVEKEEKGADKTTESQLAEIEQLMNISHFYPTADPWGQKIQTLGVFRIHAVPFSFPFFLDAMHFPLLF